MTDHETIEAEVVRENDEPGENSANGTIVAAADILPPTLYLLPLSERPFSRPRLCRCCSTKIPG